MLTLSIQLFCCLSQLISVTSIFTVNVVVSLQLSGHPNLPWDARPLFRFTVRLPSIKQQLNFIVAWLWSYGRMSRRRSPESRDISSVAQKKCSAVARRCLMLHLQAHVVHTSFLVDSNSIITFILMHCSIKGVSHTKHWFRSPFPVHWLKLTSFQH